jgi:uncharacterized protein
MPTSPLLAVRGEATLEVEPELARIEVSVAATAADIGEVRRLLAERGAVIEKILGEFGDLIEKDDSSEMRLTAQLPGRVGASDDASAGADGTAGYQGVVHHCITVTGFDRLGELLARLSVPEMTEVGGPYWDLRPGSQVYREARAAAVADAVSRARDYAAAMGSELSGLVELADAHLLSEMRGQAEARALAAPAPRLPQRQRALAAPAPVFDLAPARQRVRASVEARFTISEPDLSGVAAC